MLAHQKQQLRQQMKLLSQQADAAVREKESATLAEKLFLLPEWKKAQTILLYAPLIDEPDLLKILEEKKSRRFLFPCIQNEQLLLHEWKPHFRWIPNCYGIQEPDPKTWPLVPVEEVDLMLVPGMAFDRNGGRLGRGRGFFDRLLSQPECRARKIGIAWSWQLVEQVPREHFDVPMDAVLLGDRRLEIEDRSSV